MLESLRRTRKTNGGSFWLQYPNGAECDLLTYQHYSAIFGIDHEGEGYASRYINGLSGGDPIQDDEFLLNRFLVNMDEEGNQITAVDMDVDG